MAESVTFSVVPVITSGPLTCNRSLVAPPTTPGVPRLTLSIDPASSVKPFSVSVPAPVVPGARMAPAPMVAVPAMTPVPPSVAPLAAATGDVSVPVTNSVPALTFVIAADTAPLNVVVPAPACRNVPFGPPRLIVFAIVTALLRLMDSVPDAPTVTLPVPRLPVAPPLPICNVPAPISVRPV